MKETCLPPRRVPPKAAIEQTACRLQETVYAMPGPAMVRTQSNHPPITDMLSATLFFANNELFITLGVVLGIGLTLLLWIAALYNGLGGARNRYKDDFGQ